VRERRILCRMAMLLSSRSARDIILPMMRTYELMVVAKPDFPVDDEARRKSLVQDLVGEGVSVDTISVVGKKRLAYEIKKQTEGVYLLATLTGQSIKNAEIQKRANVNASVLRFLLIIKH